MVATVGRGMEKEKEKQAEKGRDRRKERRSGQEQKKEVPREEERDTTAIAGHQFFKVFFPKQSLELLKIPSSFHEYVEEKPNRVVSLKGPSGNTWNVVLTSGTQGLGFTIGWKEFACDHSLVSGHFLLFTYDGHSEFSVAVFSASGVKDKGALKVQPSKELLFQIEEDEEGAVDVDAAATSEVSSDLPLESDRRSTRKRVRQINDQGTTPKRHSSVQKKPEATAGTSIAAPTVGESNQVHQCMLDELSCINKTRIRSKDVPRKGNFVSKKFRQPTVISQRCRVTEEEKNNALERANKFKSRYPFTVQVMMESYVYVGFFMNIPREFVRKSLPQKNKMTLWDPQGKPWEVNCVYYNDDSVAAFSGGWGKFSIGNNLEKFDVCVFELFKEDNFKVHIYRVLQEITPLNP